MEFIFHSSILLTVFDAIVILADVTYLYYWFTVIIAQSHNYVNTEVITSDKLSRAFKKAQEANSSYRFLVQITTKGGSMHVVKRGIDNVIEAVKKYPQLQEYVSIEVVTEAEQDIAYLETYYSNENIAITGFLLPGNYITPQRTHLKARALQYMVEQHRLNPTKNCYVVHYNEESVFTPDNFARLVHQLLTHPADISEGQISYGLDWKEASLFCRVMESNRPFGCNECYVSMSNPPPSYMHGSNLVVNQALENDIGWDMGQYKNCALVTEDLIFGLQVYIKYGKKVFGWHRAEMLETPPFTVAAAVKQRERWVFGALQAVNYIQEMKEWHSVSLIQRVRILVMVYFKIAAYAVGFPLSILSIAINAVLIVYNIYLFYFTRQVLPANLLSYLLIPGLLMWIGSIQYGLSHNLRYVDFSLKEKIFEHVKVFFATPFAGVVETYGPFKAVVKWICGQRQIVWIPTPKTIPS